MSFLTPLFWLGAAAIALPVVFHLIRRTTREQTAFSSLMFLMPSPPRLTRRNRLEHILLLLLRCLVLCLLAAAFARPFIKKAMNSGHLDGTGKRTVVLVDTSASMRRENLWANARDRVDSILRKGSPADQVAVFTFDRQIIPVVSFEQWNAAPSGERVALVKQKLAGTSPGWSSTYLGNALIQAAEMLGDAPGQPLAAAKEIVLISDLQEGSRLDQLQGYEWPKQIRVIIEALKPRHISNAGLQLVMDSDNTTSTGIGAVRVRVSNAANSRVEQFKVGWAGGEKKSFIGKPVDIYVPAGQSRIVQLDWNQSSNPGAPNARVPTADRILLQGDDEDFDNSVFVIPPEKAQTIVVYFGSESEKTPQQPLYFLKRAFQDTRGQTVQVRTHSPNTPLTEDEAKAASIFIVTENLSAGLADALRQQLETGKTVLYLLRTAEAAAGLGYLVQTRSLSAEEARPKNYAMLAEINFQHPLFSAFADPRFSDFTRIHFWKYRRLSPEAIPNARVLAKFDDGAPAFIEVPLGKGRILVMTSGWHPDDSQLALSTKFVPLLYALLEESGSSLATPAQYFVGDTVPLTAFSPDKRPTTVKSPDGSQFNPAPQETSFSHSLMPGIYDVTLGDKHVQFAVNVDAAESRTAPLPADELERFGAPLAHIGRTKVGEADHKARLQNAELESRQKLWRWFILGTIGLLFAETWLAGRTARRVVVQEEAAT